VGQEYANMVASALSARSAVGHQSASTVVYALHARSAVGHKYASTIVYALSARSVVGHQSASTVVYALSARSAVGHHSASTVVSALDARTVEAINNITHSALVQALTPFPRNIQSSSSLSSPPFAAAAVGTALLGADRTDGACENRSSSLSSE
jgi:predicted nucleic acid-binding protein